MSESISIWCFIIGDNQTFQVRIDPAGSVDDLKTQIKKRNQVGLKDIDADRLTLYQAELKGSIARVRQDRIDELKRLSQNLNECTFLDELQQLSDFFGENSEEKQCYAIVQLPKGEPIGSMIACR